MNNLTEHQERSPLTDFATDYLLSQWMDNGKEATPSMHNAEVEISILNQDPVSNFFGNDPKGRRGQGPSVLSTSRDLPSFYAYVSGETIKITHGVVFSQNIGNDPSPINAVVPTINGEEIGIQGGSIQASTGTIYVKVNTNTKGVVLSATIEVGDPDGSVHHEPPSGESGGVDGLYKFPIAEISSGEDFNGNQSLYVSKRNTGNIFIPNQLIEIENIGTGVSIYSGYKNGQDDKHEFKKIAGRGSFQYDSTEEDAEEQIRIVEDTETNDVRAIGNGYDGTLSFKINDLVYPSLKWKDGLVVKEDTIVVEIPVIPENPAPPTSDTITILTNDGSGPVWSNFAVKSIMICEGGVPTPIKVIVIP